MLTIPYLTKILGELSTAVDFMKDEDAEKLVNGILESKKIFVAGAGRSGLMAKSFAMRMMHMGFDAYVIGETITPNFEKEDILIIGSGSGETKSLVSMVEKAKSIGGTIAAITIFPDSTIGKQSDIVIKLPGSPKDKTEGQYQTIQPMGSLFEQTLLLFLDAVILRLMEKKGLDSTAMFHKHANLE
jgi:6-phospho-3-hexuloisomerase